MTHFYIKNSMSYVFLHLPASPSASENGAFITLREKKNFLHLELFFVGSLKIILYEDYRLSYTMFDYYNCSLYFLIFNRASQENESFSVLP